MGQRLQLAQLDLGFAQGGRDAALLTLKQILVLHDDQRAIQVSHFGSHPRRSDLTELARERLHRAALRCHLQRLGRRVVPERQRNEAVVADAVEFEIQLRTPKTTILSTAWSEPLPRPREPTV